MYDGDCGICQASVRALRRVGCRADMVPSHEWLVDHPDDADRCAEAVLVVTDDGRVLDAERAVAEALRLSRGPVRLAGPVLDAPGVRWAAARAYRRIAANRTRISRRLGLDACAVPADIDHGTTRNHDGAGPRNPAPACTSSTTFDPGTSTLPS